MAIWIFEIIKFQGVRPHQKYGKTDWVKWVYWEIWEHFQTKETCNMKSVAKIRLVWSTLLRLIIFNLIFEKFFLLRDDLDLTKMVANMTPFKNWNLYSDFILKLYYANSANLKIALNILFDDTKIVSCRVCRTHLV